MSRVNRFFPVNFFETSFCRTSDCFYSNTPGSVKNNPWIYDHLRINRPYIIDGYDKYFRIFNRVFWYLQRDTKSKIHIQSARRVVDKVVYAVYYGFTSGADF